MNLNARRFPGSSLHLAAAAGFLVAGAAAAAGIPLWTEHTIDDAFSRAFSVAAADIDGDGDLDALGAAAVDDDIVWWENTAGDGTRWVKRRIDLAFDGARSAAPADVVGDGDLDVLGAAFEVDLVAWWENTAGDGTAWTERTIDAAFDGAWYVTPADVDGDGDLDVLGAAASADDIAWFENTTGTGTSWTRHTIDAAIDSPDMVAPADVDGDGDLDVLGAANVDDVIVWYGNTTGDGTSWTERRLIGAIDGARSVAPADVDGDGDLDVFGAAQDADTIAWWENAAGTGISWVEHTVDAAVGGAMSVVAADIDDDGDVDVLGAGFEDHTISWWENITGTGTRWIRRKVDGVFNRAKSVAAADVDGDGDLDVLGASLIEGSVACWKNETFHPPARRSHQANR